MINHTMKTITNLNWIQRLQQKWGVVSTWSVIAILLTFTFSGSSVVLLRKSLFNLLEYNAQTPFWLKTITYVFFIFPTYQILLLVYGALLGQFEFFWEKEKKLGSWVKSKIFKK